MSGARLIVAMCLAEIVGMTGFASFPALLPTFLAEWQLTNTEAGWISGVYYAGYMAAVPILVGLTDRVDPRRVYLLATLVTAAAGFGFALFAEGFGSALALRALAGAGLAGTYMPGLKALTDRVEERLEARAVAFYTASFGIGSSLSFLLAGEIATAMGWRWAFALAALGPAVAFPIVYVMLPTAPPGPPPDRRLLDFRPVFRNRRAIGYVLAYAAHNWELFGFRSWVVAFLVFSQSLQPASATGAGWSATVLAALFNLIGWPSSVLGNEAAQRFGRRRAVIAFMSISALVASLIGFAAPLPFVIVVALFFAYGVTVTWDSSSITAGVVAAAANDERGATMAVHSLVGFAGAFTGPLVFGVVLDLAGGGTSLLAWGLGFAVLGAGVVLGPVAVALSARGDAG